jgi:hypothetical protein
MRAPQHDVTPNRPWPTALVVVTGDDVYEDLFTAVDQLRDLLTAEGFVTRTAIGTDRLADAGADDLIVLYTAAGRFTVAQRQGLARAVETGAGLLAVHSTAVLTSPPDQELFELIGSRYVSHGPPPHESRLRVRLDPDHELTRGIEPFELTHEHYRLVTAPDVRVLAWRTTADGPEPLVHVRAHGRGRVCYLQFGHDRRAWGEPAVRQLFRRAARWAGRPGPDRGDDPSTTTQLPVRTGKGN